MKTDIGIHMADIIILAVLAALMIIAARIVAGFFREKKK